MSSPHVPAFPERWGAWRAALQVCVHVWQLMAYLKVVLQLMAALHARKCVAISSRAVSAGAESSRPFYKKALAEAALAAQLCPAWAQAHLLQVCVVDIDACIYRCVYIYTYIHVHTYIHTYIVCIGCFMVSAS